MPFYSDIAPYLKPGFPEPWADVGRYGNRYVYVGADATIGPTASDTRALVGTTWADGALVNSAQWVPFKDFSGSGELHVTTSVVSLSGSFGSTLEQSFTELTWQTVEHPLERHPDFRAATATTSAGTYDLSQNASDGKKNLQHVIGWRLESDANLKAQYKYRLITNGVVSGSATTIPDSSALKFCRLLAAGVEVWVQRLPVWTKHSIYTGSTPPSTGSRGLKVSAPTGAPSTSPTGESYEWVKTDDQVQRIGMTMRWHRVEIWEAMCKVYADEQHVYPPSS